MQSVQRGWENWAPTTENQVDPDLTLNNQSYTRSVSLALVCDFRFNPFASHGATEQCPCLCDPAWVSGAVSTFTWSVCFVYTLVHSAYLDNAVVFGVISLFSLFSKPLSPPLPPLLPPSLMMTLSHTHHSELLVYIILHFQWIYFYFGFQKCYFLIII